MILTVSSIAIVDLTIAWFNNNYVLLKILILNAYICANQIRDDR